MKKVNLENMYIIFETIVPNSLHSSLPKIGVSLFREHIYFNIDTKLKILHFKILKYLHVLSV